MRKKGIIFIVCVVFVAIIIFFFLLYIKNLGNMLPEHNPSWYLDNRKSFEDKKVVVCAGDSFTHGKVSCDYTKMLSNRITKHDFFVVNAGINSELSYNLLSRIDDIIACDPDYVTILIGTNDSNGSIDEFSQAQKVKKMDLPRNPSPEWFGENLSLIIERLKSETSAKIALLSLPPITEDVDHKNFRYSLLFNKIIYNTANRYEISYIPVREKMMEILNGRYSHLVFDFKQREIETSKAFIMHKVFKQDWNRISKNNHFLLLTDSVHLNCRGAEIVCDLIEKFILDNQ